MKLVIFKFQTGDNFMSIKSKAAVAYKAGAPLSVEMVNVALPKDNEVLIEIKATGICHTDAFTLSGRIHKGFFLRYLDMRVLVWL